LIQLLFSYLLNCFILLLPVLIWNLIFYKKLPDLYQNKKWDNIPKGIKVVENILRIFTFIFPLFLKLTLSSSIQCTGLIIYMAGIILYFMSWIMQIYFPETVWSRSMLGFMAPAYTTIIWLSGISLIGQKMIFDLGYNFSIYLIISLLFVVIHTVRSFLVYNKNSSIE